MLKVQKFASTILYSYISIYEHINKQKESIMEVKVYSSPYCGYCTKAKSYFQSNGVKFIEYDVSKNTKYAQELVNKTGQMGVPVIIIGNQTIIGFDKAKIDKILNIA